MSTMKVSTSFDYQKVYLVPLANNSDVTSVCILANVAYVSCLSSPIHFIVNSCITKSIHFHSI